MPARPTFVVATRSRHKLGEIREILADVRVDLITLDDAGVIPASDEDDIEAFDTFRENALAKARWFMYKTGLPTIADDSGIMLDALGGAPGVRSKRFSGRTDLDGNDLDRANNQLAVQRLAQVDSAQHRAHYMCVAALVRTDGHVFTTCGSCSGSFLLEPRGNGGFGYDPHFLVDGASTTFGQMDAHEKHRFSHRARAFRALAPMLY